jgi:ribonuclease VapC
MMSCRIEKHLVLDISAVLALIEDEAGADRVEHLLRSDQALVPWPVLMETYNITQREQGQADADRRYAMLKRAADILWEIDEPVLLTAARLKAQHPISFADALIAAYAVRRDATLVHKDPEYAVLEGTVKLEPLPYK